MPNSSCIWILVNCTSSQEAKKIGTQVLNQRLASCINIIKGRQAIYFWPPKTNQKETSTGDLLVIETLENKYKQVAALVKTLHSDKLPFIGYIPIHGLDQKLIDWIKGEVKSPRPKRPGLLSIYRLKLRTESPKKRPTLTPR